MDDLLPLLSAKLSGLGPWGLAAGVLLTLAYHRVRGLAGAPKPASVPHPVAINGKPIEVRPTADLASLPTADLIALKDKVNAAVESARKKIEADAAALAPK